MNKLQFWADEDYYKHPPLTDEMVKNAQKELGVNLPDLLIELLKVRNGGYTKGFRFPMSEKTSWADGYVSLETLLGIVEGAISILSTQYMTEEWGLPEKQVILSGEGDWWITLDYRQGDIPTVRWIDVDSDEDVHVADTFEDFINGLISDDR